MTGTYLNGKITLSSVAAPTAEDLDKLDQLLEEERRALAAEILERGRVGSVSDVSLEDIWKQAIADANLRKQKPGYAV